MENDLRIDLEAMDDPLEVERVADPDLEQVVGLAGDVVALLDLGDRPRSPPSGRAAPVPGAWVSQVNARTP